MKKILLFAFVCLLMCVSCRRYKEGVQWVPCGTKMCYLEGKLIDGNGIIRKHYRNGILINETPYKNGKENGIQLNYYKRGNLMAEIPYRDGKLVGIEKGYYVNGTLMWEVSWKDNKQEGIA